MRACNGCTACCVVPEIDILGKPLNTPCRFQVEGGCGVHGTAEQPQLCKGFYCDWMLGFGADGEDPRTAGFFVQARYEQDDVLGIVSALYECIPGALETEKARLKIHELFRRGYSVGALSLTGAQFIFVRPGVDVPRWFRRRCARLGIRIIDRLPPLGSVAEAVLQV